MMRNIAITGMLAIAGFLYSLSTRDVPSSSKIPLQAVIEPQGIVRLSWRKPDVATKGDYHVYRNLALISKTSGFALVDSLGNLQFATISPNRAPREYTYFLVVMSKSGHAIVSNPVFVESGRQSSAKKGIAEARESRSKSRSLREYSEVNPSQATKHFDQ